MSMIRIILGIVISFVALYFSFHNMNFGRFLLILRITNWPLILLSVSILISSIWIHAWRWQVILQQSKKITMRRLVEGQFIGYFGNNVLPLRMGEILRSYILSEQEEIKFSEVFSSVVNERLLDILAVVSLVTILFLSGFLLPDNVTTIFWTYMGIVAIVLGVCPSNS